VHLALLGLLTLPVTLVALVRAPSLAPHDVVAEILKVPYMTANAYVARGVSLLFSLGIVVAVGRIADEVRGKRAGQLAALTCATNAPLTYYGHTTNLDVPYLFWAMASLLALVRAVARHEPRRLRAAFTLAVLAIGTKDQAYAIFAVTVPAVVAVWFARDPWPRAHAREVVRATAIAAALAIALFLVTDAVVFNPTGFRARVAFLVGPASQDFVQYSKDAIGRALVLRDATAFFVRYYPLVFVLPCLIGAAMLVRGAFGTGGRAEVERGRAIAGLVPLIGALSFTLFFNCVARRTEERFLLPQYVALAVPIGVALEPFAFALQGKMRQLVARVTMAVAFVWAFFRCAAVDASLVLDPRYDAEAWLAAHTAPGDSIETYGLNVYLPRFPAGAVVSRVGHEPLAARNPLPGVTELVGRYGEVTARGPRYVVVSEGWVWRYLIDVANADTSGRVLAPVMIAAAEDADPVQYFQALFHDQGPYRRAYAAQWSSSIWPRLDIHASTCRAIFIFERPGGDVPQP
jgi:4-amino-4-deoxy-L-arabinose transferase-like glycosyltransferase